MGVPSRGADYSRVEQLSRFHRQSAPSVRQYRWFQRGRDSRQLRRVEPHVDGVEISLMCPNLKPGEAFDEIARCGTCRPHRGRRKPAIVRVPNDTVALTDRLAELVERCVEAGVEGIEGRRCAGRWRSPGSALDRAPCTAVRRSRARSPTWKTPRVSPAVALRSKATAASAAAPTSVALLRAGVTCIDLYPHSFTRAGISPKINRELLESIEAGGDDVHFRAGQHQMMGRWSNVDLIRGPPFPPSARRSLRWGCLRWRTAQRLRTTERTADAADLDCAGDRRAAGRREWPSGAAGSRPHYRDLRAYRAECARPIDALCRQQPRLHQLSPQQEPGNSACRCSDCLATFLSTARWLGRESPLSSVSIPA